MNTKMRSFLKGLALGLAGKPLEFAPGKEPVAYLYNGKRYPPLPTDWDSKLYPCCTITNGTKTRLYLTNYPGTGYGGNFYLKGQGGNLVKVLEYKLVNDRWEDLEINEYTSISIGCTGIIFTNYDLYHPETGALTFAASEPVPVYE